MQKQVTRVPVRVRVGAVKIHGPNSPEVLEGRVPEGYREKLETEGPVIQEVDYETAVGMFGREAADEMFRGVPEEDR